MENKKTNSSDGSDTQNGNTEPNLTSQNKYPGFDMGGDNYSNKKSTEINNLTSPLPDDQKSADDLAPEPLSVQTAGSAENPQGQNGSTATSSTSGGSLDTGYASIRRRYFASLIDGLIVGTVSVILNLPMYVSQFQNIIALYNVSDPSLYQEKFEVPFGSSSNPVYNILSIVAFLFGIAYPIYFIGKNGATPGKKLLKIKVIDKEKKEVPGFLKAFLRETVGKFISAIFLGIGYFWAIGDKDKQTWHDKIAGTVVISTNIK